MMRSLRWLGGVAATALVCATFVCASSLRAQTPQDSDRAAVLATVQKVFDAMRTRDTSLLFQAFDTTGRLAGVSGRGGSPSVSLTTPTQFAAGFLRAPAGDVWNERIFD